MNRQQKINRIKHLIDGYNNIKDYVLTNKFFYTDGNNFYTDRTHKNKIDKEFKVIIDRKEGNYFVGRTQFDSPDVDNEVLINAKKFYIRSGDFATVKIISAEDFDLYAEVIS